MTRTVAIITVCVIALPWLVGTAPTNAQDVILNQVVASSPASPDSTIRAGRAYCITAPNPWQDWADQTWCGDTARVPAYHGDTVILAARITNRTGYTAPVGDLQAILIDTTHANSWVYYNPWSFLDAVLDEQYTSQTLRNGRSATITISYSVPSHRIGRQPFGLCVTGDAATLDTNHVNNCIPVPLDIRPVPGQNFRIATEPRTIPETSSLTPVQVTITPQDTPTIPRRININLTAHASSELALVRMAFATPPSRHTPTTVQNDITASAGDTNATATLYVDTSQHDNEHPAADGTITINAANGNDTFQPATITVTDDDHPDTIHFTVTPTEVFEDDDYANIVLQASMDHYRFVRTHIQVHIPGRDQPYPMAIPANVLPAAVSHSVTIAIPTAPESTADTALRFRMTNDAGFAEQTATVTVRNVDPAPEALQLSVHPTHLDEGTASQTLNVTATYMPRGTIRPYPTRMRFIVHQIESIPPVTPSDDMSNRRNYRSSYFNIVIPADRTSFTHAATLRIPDNDIASGNIRFRVIGQTPHPKHLPVRAAGFLYRNDDIGAPRDLQLDATANTVTIHWRAASEPSIRPTVRYIILTAAEPSGPWQTLVDSPHNQIRYSRGRYYYQHTGRQPSTTYHFRVHGRDDHHRDGPTTPTATATTLPAPPGPPQAFQHQQYRNRVILTWHPPAADGGRAIRHYRLQAQYPQQLPFDLATVPATARTYVHRHDQPDSVIRYILWADNGAAGDPIPTSLTVTTQPAYQPYHAYDFNHDGAVTPADAIILQYAHTRHFRPHSQAETVRRTLLHPYLPSLPAPHDDDYLAMLQRAQQVTFGAATELDLDQSGYVSTADAAILYYMLQYPEIMGPPDYPKLQRLLLRPLTPPQRPYNEDVRQRYWHASQTVRQRTTGAQ